MNDSELYRMNYVVIVIVIIIIIDDDVTDIWITYRLDDGRKSMIFFNFFCKYL